MQSTSKEKPEHIPLSLRGYCLAQDHGEDLLRFRRQLATVGLRIRDVPDDGDCLFRALGDQLEGQTTNHLTHRDQTCDYIENNRDDFEDLIDQLVELYLEKLRTPLIYADEAALVGFGRLHERCVWIHELDKHPRKLDQLALVSWPELHLSCHDEDHYASIRRIDDDGFGPADVQQIQFNSIAQSNGENAFANRMHLPPIEFTSDDGPIEQSHDVHLFDDAEYEIDAILDFDAKDGERYQVRWQQPLAVTSWQPVSSLTLSQSKIRSFWANMRKCGVTMEAVRNSDPKQSATELKAILVTGRAAAKRQGGGGVDRPAVVTPPLPRSRDRRAPASRDPPESSGARGEKRSHELSSPPTAEEIFGKKKARRMRAKVRATRQLFAESDLFDADLTEEEETKKENDADGRSVGKEESSESEEEESSETSEDSDPTGEESDVDDFIEDDVPKQLRVDAPGAASENPFVYGRERSWERSSPPAKKATKRTPKK